MIAPSDTEKPRRSPIALTAAMLLLVCLWPPVLPFDLPLGFRADAQPSAAGVTDTATTQQPKLVVMTYNIELGIHSPGAISRIVEFIRKQKPDIVCLQEATWSKSETGLITGHPSTIAEALGGYDFCVTARHAGDESRTFGMAILTRGTIVDHEALAVEGKKNYGLLARIDIDGVHLIAVSVHLRSLSGATLRGAMKSEPGRVRQANHLIKRLAGERGAVIIAGDFNALPVFPSYGVVAKHYKDAASGKGELASTRRTGGLGARIDYVFLSDSVVSSNYQVWPVDHSDHRPITVDIVFPPGRERPPDDASDHPSGGAHSVQDKH